MAKEKKQDKKTVRFKSKINFAKQEKNLAERIKSLRIAKGYTSYEYFAYDHGFSRSQFGRYEKGQDLRFSTRLRLAEAFDMTIEEFFNEGFE